MYAGIVFAVTRKTATYKPTNESAYIHGTIRGDAVLSCEVDRRLQNGVGQASGGISQNDIFTLTCAYSLMS